MKTIFNTCVKVTSQKQCSRLRQICIENKLQYWNDKIAFRFDGIKVVPTFEYVDSEFGIYNSGKDIDKIVVSESEWLELLEQHNKTKQP